MLVDIKSQLNDPAVRRILSLSLFDKSPEGVEKSLNLYKDEQFFGWKENGAILGLCGFRVTRDEVGICRIAVAEAVRKRGVGSSMIAALKEKYELPLKAETDDDAVGFYRKCGFETTSLYKYYKKYNGGNVVRRWNCLYMPAEMFESETEEEGRARIYPIFLSEYNPAWPEWYAEEKTALERLIGADNIANISHIGSTSVPGLTAKPIIDILLEINESADVGDFIASLPSSEYICLDEASLTMETSPPHLMFLKGYLPDGFAERVFNIHVRYPGDWDEPLFRDHLTAHPEAAGEYAALKLTLSREFERDRDGYTSAKGAFVKGVMEKIRGALNK